MGSDDKPESAAKKKITERFPLRLPVDLDKEVREWAQGDGTRPPYSINDALIHLIREGLRVVKASVKGSKQEAKSVVPDAPPPTE
jgi:hypothetical protein